MMVLVTADNYLVMFVGWEGVGLCSYLLIGFWYEKGKDGIANAVAGKKAFVVNRIGDFGFMIAMFLVFVQFGTLQFDEVFHQAEELGLAAAGIATAITLFLLLAATGKSAQLPLFVWLPDAMAGPTPVSALIHAATMVTAGIYMLVRNAVLLELAPLTSLIIAFVGGITGLLAATIAVGQFDIKRVLAYSTISQLGFMVAAVGVGAYVAAMFHLVTHAFFKALLFLAAGSVILGIEHGHHKAEAGHAGEESHGEEFDPNDMRGMGGLRKKMSITFAVYLVGSLALMGIPPFAGFFSKDEILTDASESQLGVFLILTTAAFLTAFYMGRQILMVFYGESRSAPAENAHESPPTITVPLVILALLSFFGGAINVPGLHPLTTYLSTVLEHAHVTEFNLVIAPLAALLAVAAVVLAWFIYGRRTMAVGDPDPLERGLGPLFTAVNKAWWFDELYDRLFVQPYSRLSTFLAEIVDWRFWHDWFHDSLLAAPFRNFTAWLTRFDLKVIDGAANALASGVAAAAGSLGKLQSGYVRNYALAVFIGVLLIIAVFLIQ
jgi:NADH-quinone oxidoreductase subunit L